MHQQISYFHINWLSEEDGSGKRVVLFMQGCPLDCLWCHSPHSQPEQSPLLFFEGLCTYCERCKDSCHNGVHTFVEQQHIVDREKCIKCGKCIESCPKSSINQQANALSLPTQKASVDCLFKNLKPHLELLKNHGGITFSGGEPLGQVDALTELAKKCKKHGFHTSLETSGIVPLKSIEKIAPYIDTWLLGMRLVTGTKKFDIKFLEERTREAYGFLKELNATIIIRIPAISDYTNNIDYLRRVKEIIGNDISKIKIDVLPQNSSGAHFYNATNHKYLIKYNKQEANRAYKDICSFFEQ